MTYISLNIEVVTERGTYSESAKDSQKNRKNFENFQKIKLASATSKFQSKVRIHCIHCNFSKC